MSEPEIPAIPDDVCTFLGAASLTFGRYSQEEFSQSMWSDCHKIASPIEQLFYIAMHLVSEINCCKLRAVAEFNDKSDALLLIKQWKAGNYFVDFALRRHPENVIVCVELDGHQFHDRDEPQRRYEKRRDRYLTARGYRVLHFTGSEVVKDPYATALEAFNLVTGLEHVSIHPRDLYE